MEQVLGVEVQPTASKEPVLDVPAIDMTSSIAETTPARAVEASGASTGNKRARRAGSKAKQSSRATSVDAKPKSGRDGSVGRDTFERVEALLKGGTTKKEAFGQIAVDTGKNIGTVSANYYRVARANGAVKPRQPGSKAAPTRSAGERQNQSVSRGNGARADNGHGNVDQIVSEIVASVQALTDAMRAQNAEVRELRGRLDGVRTALR
jgi:hypothetical protein